MAILDSSAGPNMTRPHIVIVWLLRVSWVTLPLTVGPALASVAADWDAPVRVVSEALLWVTWSSVVIALFAPRPLGLTVVRAATPLATAVVVAAGVRAGGWTGWLSIVVIAITFVLALAPAFTAAAVNGPAYGAERRFALRVPPALFLGPLPLAIALVGAGVAAGPLLLAARQWVAGVVALVGGVPLAVVAARSLHGLSRRWAVLVPAGFVLADSATLQDPVLFRREKVRALRPLPVGARPDTGDLDLRVGAQRGGISITLDEESDMLHVRRGRRDSEQVPTRIVWFAVVGRDDLLARAGRRRMRVVRE